MDKKKQIDLIRKRNSDLSKQFNDLKFKLELDSKLNIDSYKIAKDLINDLEKIKLDWNKSLDEIQNYKIQYAILINELKEIKKTLNSMGFKLPHHKRIVLTVKRVIISFKAKLNSLFNLNI